MVVFYLALSQGDAWAAATAASGAGCRRKGGGRDRNLLRASYDLQPQPVATVTWPLPELWQRQPPWLLMLVPIARRGHRRSAGRVRMLQKRQLVVVASLRERVLDAALAEGRHRFAGRARTAAARYLAERAAAHEVLRNHRVMVLDVTCEELPKALVERYLAIKRDGLL